MDEVAKYRAQESVLKQRVVQKQVTAKKLPIYMVHDTRNFTKSDELRGTSAWLSCEFCKSSAQVTVTAKLEEHPQSISYELFILTWLSLCPYPWNISVLISGSSLLYTENVLRKSQVTYIETTFCTWLLEGDTFDSDIHHTVRTRAEVDHWGKTQLELIHAFNISSYAPYNDNDYTV